jgi:hypothetical protein
MTLTGFAGNVINARNGTPVLYLTVRSIIRLTGLKVEPPDLWRSGDPREIEVNPYPAKQKTQRVNKSRGIHAIQKAGQAV